jgi:simple sugar transport system ATP-binding protein
LADEGKAVVVISSYLPEVMALSDRILVCRTGKVVEEFSALEATEEKIMYAAIH